MRGEIIHSYQKLKSEDQKAFSRWLWSNTIVGATLLAGLVALTSNFAGDESGAAAQKASTSTQAKLIPTPSTRP